MADEVFQVYLNLYETAEGVWTNDGPHFSVERGVLCHLPDGRGIGVTHDGRVLTFAPDGRCLADEKAPAAPAGAVPPRPHNRPGSACISIRPGTEVE